MKVLSLTNTAEKYRGDWSIDMYAHCGFCPTIINKYFDSYLYTNIDEYYLCRNCGLAYL